MKTFITLLCLGMIFSQSYAQRFFKERRTLQNSQVETAPAEFKYIPKKPGHYTAEDWRAAIDSTWGPGLPTADKLKIFDLFWETIDEDYAGFHNLDVNWDSLRNVYRPEIESGVSRGRFSGIMDQLFMALMEIHTHIYDGGVRQTRLDPGVPLLVYLSAYYFLDNGHFGAGLTPLPDSSALVYKVVENHPLGVERGDIVVGYNGIPWKNLYHELIAAELPVTTFTKPFANAGLGSSERSVAHIWLMSAGLNWHLFDTIDIIKYGSIDTLHLSNSALIGLNEQLICTEQMPIPGVPMPDIANPYASWVSWGIVDGTQIGYIYVSGWETSVGDGAAFTNAVNTLIDDYQTTGLIIDFRSNPGGQPGEANGGFSRLFNFDLNLLEFAERSDPDNHFAMRPITSGYCSGGNWRFQADSYLYDRPIAVLTGPVTISSGDYNAMRIKYHPMVKIFGKPTNTAFTCFASEGFHNLDIHSGWLAGYAPRNTYLADDPDNYLIHVGFEVDEEVWLTQEDVAKGEDTVVKSAMEWINNLAYAHDVSVNKSYVTPDTDSVMVTAQVENPNQHEISLTTVIRNQDSTITDNFSLFDDGLHGDGADNDNIWGNFYVPTGEQSFKVSVTTNDISEETSRTLPNVAWFTTIGQIMVSDVSIDSVSIDSVRLGDIPRLKLTLQNEGASATATNVEAMITTDDTCVLNIGHSNPTYGDIGPGGIATTIGTYRLFIKSGCPAPQDIVFNVSIASDGDYYWEDSFSLHLYTGIDRDEKSIPIAFSLQQNYPNPFNPRTVISWQLAVGSHVNLSIYNILGEKVAMLVSERQKAGYHEVDFTGQNLSSGVYLYRIQAGEFQDVKKMILLR